jgi:NAD(P)-dependent dehydrogenase (short-subunit alcohol dehydrogenase family)
MAGRVTKNLTVFEQKRRFSPCRVPHNPILATRDDSRPGGPASRSGRRLQRTEDGSAHTVSYNLDNRVAFVTGASYGIGFATARRLACAGATVVICARGQDALDTAVAAIRDAGGRVTGRVLDVCDAVALADALGETAERHGSLDILVNNAAAYAVQPIADTTLDQWRHFFAVNVEATFVSTKEAMRLMARQRSGAIINLSSIYGVRAQAGVAAYSATKAAIIQFTAVAAMEAAAFGVRINSVVPGIIDTPLTQEIFRNTPVPDLAGMLAGGVPLQRFGEADEIANVIAFLASPDASYITGSCLSVDGGKGSQFPMTFAAAQ